MIYQGTLKFTGAWTHMGLGVAMPLPRAGLAEIGSSLTFRGGFYNVKIRDGLRVISLQTNYASELNL